MLEIILLMVVGYVIWKFIKSNEEAHRTTSCGHEQTSNSSRSDTHINSNSVLKETKGKSLQFKNVKYETNGWVHRECRKFCVNGFSALACLSLNVELKKVYPIMGDIYIGFAVNR